MSTTTQNEEPCLHDFSPDTGLCAYCGMDRLQAARATIEELRRESGESYQHAEAEAHRCDELAAELSQLRAQLEGLTKERDEARHELTIANGMLAFMRDVQETAAKDRAERDSLRTQLEGLRRERDEALERTRKQQTYGNAILSSLMELVQDGECYCCEEGVANKGPCGHCTAKGLLELGGKTFEPKTFTVANVVDTLNEHLAALRTQLEAVTKERDELAAAQAALAASKGEQWRPIGDELPKLGQRVIAMYKGVYGHRIVTFWRDAGGNAHFGLPDEPDGKGSQPATHWQPLPPPPTTHEP